MAWTHTYDVNTPAGTDDPKEGDDRIREVKAALQERLARDHYFPKTGSQVSDENAGEHKKITLRVGSAPTAVVDKGFIYAKDVGDPAKAELFYRDEDGDEIQITSGGILNQLNLAPKIHSAIGTTNISTASTSYVDMTNMSITATFPAGKVLINFCAGVRLLYVRISSVIVIDSVIKNTVHCLNSYNTNIPASVNWVETLTAGEHTIKIQWKVDGGTGYQDGAECKRVLTILECR